MPALEGTRGDICSLEWVEWMVWVRCTQVKMKMKDDTYDGKKKKFRTKKAKPTKKINTYQHKINTIHIQTETF